MMGTPFVGGEPALKILDVDGVTVLKTVYLPSFTRNEAVLSWQKKNVMWELVDGSTRERVIGLVPKLTLKWKLYDDISPTARAKGSLNGNRARLQDLISLLTTAPGLVVVSPGPAPGGTTTVSGAGFGVGTGAQVTYQLQHAVGRYETDALGTWPIYTTPRTNLLTYSEQLDNAAWSKSNATVTANAATAPDGNLTFDKVVESAISSQHYIYKSVTLAAGQYTLSVWAKAAERNWLCMNAFTGPTALAFFNLSAGTVGTLSGCTATITPHPTMAGVYRCTMTFTASTTAGDLGFRTANADNSYNYAGDGTSGLYAWGTQLETGSAASSYIPTTTAAVTALPAYWPATGDGFEPCYAFSGTPQIYRQDWQGNQLLYATPRTNLLTYSQAFDNAVWTKSTSGTGSIPTVTADYTTAPDGTATADRIQLNKGAGTTMSDYALVQSGTVVVTVGGAYTLSVWMKTNDGTTKAVLFGLGGTATPIVTVTGTWQRFTFTGTMASGTDYFRLMLRGTTGSADSADLSVWGAQLETGSAASSYIPTTTTTAPVTDYTITATGAVTFSTAPLANAVLTWSGSFAEARRGFKAHIPKLPEPRMLAAGLGGDVVIEFIGRDAVSTPTLGVF